MTLPAATAQAEHASMDILQREHRAGLPPRCPLCGEVRPDYAATGCEPCSDQALAAARKEFQTDRSEDDPFWHTVTRQLFLERGV